MAQENLSRSDAGKQTETFIQLRCVTGWADEIRMPLIFLVTTNIFLSIITFVGNTLILVALHKDSSLHSPSKLMYRCLATTDVCVGLIAEPSAIMYWLSLLHGDWNLCRYAVVTYFVAGYILAAVSLLTMTAISVDRLLVLLLGLGYRQVVSSKRIYLILITFWIVSILHGASYILDHRIAYWNGHIVTPLCLVTATVSYTTIFYRLHHGLNQVQVHVPQQPSQPVPLNTVRYRKALHSALLVQLSFAVCYLPYGVAVILPPKGRLSTSEFLVVGGVVTLIFLNSSLNPFLYCWKISEVRQVVKEIIRQALSCP